jgi:2-oxoglutarate ferredoxin oxidoreductase subunit beta
MTEPEDFGNFSTAWCPGCGNFAILSTVKKALAELDLAPSEVLFVAGIGQGAKAPHYLKANIFNGLHGRGLAVATAAKAVNPNLNIIAESGDGCTYSEGGNHFLAAIRRNPNITVLVHNNHVYGLTKGQVSPTSTTEEGFITRPQPEAAFVKPFNALTVAIAMNAPFVARGFTGETDQLRFLIKEAITHKGISIVDILQPCVSFNEVDIFQKLKERCHKISDHHDPSDRLKAMELAEEWDEGIPLGILYKQERPVYEERFEASKKGPLALQRVNKEKLQSIIDSYR